jgi:diguanylate cyclase (GGDEF)-like protein
MTVFTSALAGCLLLLSWLQHRSMVALALWGAGFITASLALVIIGRGTLPDFWSIVVGNAGMAAAYGTLWSGARKFEGKDASVLAVLLGAAVWVAACLIAPIYARPEARAAVIAAIAISYTLLAIFELWRGRDDGGWRWPIVLLLLAHAAFVPLQIPLAGAWRHPDPAEVNLMMLAIFEGAFVTVCAAYLFGGQAKDRIAANYRHDALTDPLTGIANRRSFFETGGRLLLRAGRARRLTALLMFDLDNFKSINDRFGHQAGDAVLTAFCRMVAAQMRPADLFGRIGGEEFAMLLPETGEQDALRLAERLRTAFAATASRSASMRSTRPSASASPSRTERAPISSPS